MSSMETSKRQHKPEISALLVLVMGTALGACTASEVKDTATRTGIVIMRGACQAAGDCGVSCPEGSSLDKFTQACTPTPP